MDHSQHTASYACFSCVQSTGFSPPRASPRHEVFQVQLIICQQIEPSCGDKHINEGRHLKFSSLKSEYKIWQNFNFFHIVYTPARNY